MEGETIRRMGEGYEPHVDEAEGRLVYSLPVDSSIFSTSFSFPIEERDLAILLGDDHRRALLEIIAHTVLQRSLIRGNPKVTEADFRGLVDGVLHSTSGDLDRFVDAIDRSHNIRIRPYAEAAIGRRAGRSGEAGK